MGSDLGWQCVGQDSFVFTLDLYRDCNGDNLSTAILNFICVSSGDTLETVSISAPNPVDVTPICDHSCTRCDSLTCTFPYGIQKYSYTSGIVNFSSAGSCCNILVAYGACCRNNAITTISNSGTQTFYTEAQFNRCLNPCDNAPGFSDLPVKILCVGQDFINNFGVLNNDTDSNGILLDSLAYEWCNPLSSASSLINYKSPYSYSKPIYFWGFPNINLPFPRGYHLDNLSPGDIMFRPMKQEKTIMSVKVREYRNGQLIGFVRREIQMIVIPCPNNHPPALSGPFYKEICAGDTVTFTINTNEYDPGDSLLISWNNAIPGATWSTNNDSVKHPTGTLTWISTPNQASSIPYTFTATVEDDACPVTGHTTRAYQILVKALPEANITETQLDCNNFHLSAHPISGVSPYYEWTLQDASQIFTQSGLTMSHRFRLPGQYPYSMMMRSKGCSRTYYDTILVQNFSSFDLPSDTSVCYGDSILLSPQFNILNSPLSYQWSTGQQTPQATIGPIKSNLIISLTIADSVCSFRDSVFIDVIDLPQLNLGNDVYMCNYDSLLLKAQPVLDDSASRIYYKWSEKKSPFYISYDQSLIVKDSGFYFCQAEDDLGCKTMDSISVYLNPDIKAKITDQSICDGDSLHLKASITGGGQAYYNWYLGTQLLHNARYYNFIPDKDSIYKLIVHEDSNNIRCSDTTDFHIRIHPLPDTLMPDLQSSCSNVSQINLPSIQNLVWLDLQGNTITKFHPQQAGIGYHKIPYQFTDWYSGCQSTDSLGIMVYDISFVNAGEDDTLCSGSGIHLLQGQPQGNTQWQGSGVLHSAGNYYFNTEDAQVSPGGTFDLIYTYTDSNQCTNSDTLQMTLFNTPVPQAGTYPNLCSGDDPILLQGNPAEGIWSGQGIVGDSFDPAIGRGVYEALYTLYSPGGYCPKFDKAVLTVLPSPIVVFDADPLQGYAPLPVKFYQISWVTSGIITQYNWDMGDGNQDTSNSDFTHVYQNPGDYTVKLSLMTDQGCSAELKKENYIHVDHNIGVEEITRKDFYIAPNPASELAYLYVQNPDIEVFVIYNSLGEKVKSIQIDGYGRYTLSKSDLGTGVFLIRGFDRKKKLSSTYLIIL